MTAIITAAATINARTADLIAQCGEDYTNDLRYAQVKASEEADYAYEADVASANEAIADLAALIAEGRATDEDEYAYYDIRSTMRYARPDEYMPAPWGINDYIPEWRR